MTLEATPRPEHADLDFDPIALRERYREERDKRIRADGNQQYQEVKGDFAHYTDDPYVEPGFQREPLTDEVDVVIIGGGFGGQLAGARFRQARFEDVRIIEKGGDFGGTWYWNRYPGAQCDIESYMYLPLLEDLGFIPKEKYSFAPEIQTHARRIGEAFDLYREACFQTEVTDLSWDEAEDRWIVTTDRDDRMRARFVVLCSGPLNRPKLPAIPGITDFEGHTFHTSRWDYDYTGGDETGNLDKLGDKRVGIIGTGATAIQCVPHVGQSAQHLYVFQRTPSSVDERGNKPTDPDWVRELTPGWQKRRRENFNTMLTGGHAERDLVNDGWTEIFRNLASLLPRQHESTESRHAAGAAMEIADFEKMNQVRDRVNTTVEDEATADALKPWYRQFCKRPTFNDEYLPTFNRPNVTLVDTEGKGVDRITKRGIVANGVEYEVDCLIFATGFEVGTAYTRRAGLEIHGRGGVTLTDHWLDGMKTLHGFTSRGFPNIFHMGILQNGLSPNLTSMLDDQAQHIAYIIEQVKARGARRVEPSAEAEADWVATIRKLARHSYRFFEACTPGYYNNEGQPGAGNALAQEQYAPGINAFNQLLEEWRTKGELEGLELD